MTGITLAVQDVIRQREREAADRRQRDGMPTLRVIVDEGPLRPRPNRKQQLAATDAPQILWGASGAAALIGLIDTLSPGPHNPSEIVIIWTEVCRRKVRETIAAVSARATVVVTFQEGVRP